MTKNKKWSFKILEVGAFEKNVAVGSIEVMDEVTGKRHSVVFENIKAGAKLLNGGTADKDEINLVYKHKFPNYLLEDIKDAISEAYGDDPSVIDAVTFEAVSAGGADDEGMYPWNCTLKYKGKRCTFAFGDSKSVPTLEDAIASMFVSLDVGVLSYEAYCSDFGYSEEDERFKKVWKDCAKFAKDMIRVFGEDRLSKMKEEATEREWM